MYTIINVKNYSGGIEEATRYIHGKWGDKKNFEFYLDSIIHSSTDKKGLPKFFLMLEDKKIIGCYGLITNDFIRRHDLMPWFCCLFVEEHKRGQRLGEKMLIHAVEEMKNSGYSNLYLTTEHDGLYEKFGWQRIEDGYSFFGNKAKIYKMSLTD